MVNRIAFLVRNELERRTFTIWARTTSKVLPKMRRADKGVKSLWVKKQTLPKLGQRLRRHIQQLRQNIQHNLIKIIDVHPMHMRYVQQRPTFYMLHPRLKAVTVRPGKL